VHLVGFCYKKVDSLQSDFFHFKFKLNDIFSWGIGAFVIYQSMLLSWKRAGRMKNRSPLVRVSLRITRFQRHPFFCLTEEKT